MIDKVQKNNFTYYNAPSPETFGLQQDWIGITTRETK
jgi:hypothetical protein